MKLYDFLRAILYPFLRYVLVIFSPKARKRIEFELSYQDVLKSKKKYDYIFELSSEGELEQVIVVIRALLEKDVSLLLLFCSDSVEQKCINLENEYKSLDIMAYAVLTYNPLYKNDLAFIFENAKMIVLCRYDFFPELFFFGKKEGVHFCLLSASLKNFESKNIFSKSYLTFCYNSFDQIVAATFDDEQKLIKILKKKAELTTFDFRVLSINARLKVREKTLNDHFPQFLEFSKQMFPRAKNTFMFGSFWEHEASIFKEAHVKNLMSEHLFCIVPHKLNTPHLKKLLSAFYEEKIMVYLLSKQTSSKELELMLSESLTNPGVWVFNIKGVLCELYSSFNCAYVGGGFGESVHSLLEPYLSNCQIICGPKIGRSSEYTFIKEQSPMQINIFEKTDDIAQFIGHNQFHKVKKEDKAYEFRDIHCVLKWPDLKM